MAPFRRILIDIDPLAPHHPALKRGAEVAAHYRAAMTVVDVLPEVPNAARRFVTEAVEAELAVDRVARIRAETDRLSAGVPLHVSLLRGRPADAISAEASRGDFDLVVRHRGPDRGDASSTAAAIDRRLVRECPCPLWLLARGPNAPPKRILAAMDLGDAEARAFGTTILNTALRIAEPYGAMVTAFHAYHIDVDILTAYVPVDQVEVLKVDAELTATKDIQAAVAAADAGKVTPGFAVAFGESATAICDYATRHDIDLVVIGAVSRSGLQRFIVGSTAERVLHRFQQSLLIVPAARQ